jgi:DNA damage-binding protein 1
MYGAIREHGRGSDLARDAFDRNDPQLSRTIHDGRLRMSRNQENHTSLGAETLKSSVYGAVDGVLTAFAVVTGGAGGDLAPHTVLILGISSLIANAFSMGIGDIVSTLSYQEHVMEERRREEWEFDNYPEGEIKEMVDLYEERGLPREKAEVAVAIMSKYKEFFLDIMVTEELGLVLPNKKHNPYKAGLVTGLSFLVSGLLPLLSYVLLIGRVKPDVLIQVSTAATLICLFALGAMKSKFSVVSWWRGGLEFCILGGCCAFVAYMIGSIVAATVGQSIPV